MRLIVHDITGTVPWQRTAEDDVDDPVSKGRAEYLRELLRERRVDAENWEDLKPEEIRPAGSVILVHLTDMGSVKERVEALAEKGSLVVIYSGSPVPEEEASRGAGWVYRRRWDTVEEAIDSLPEGFGWREFKNVLDNPPRRNLLAAVAILSWCTLAPVDDRAVRQRQEQWRKSREKWQQVFKGVSEQEFLQAAGPEGLNSTTWPDGLGNVEKLVKWVKWVKPEGGAAGSQTEPEAPDYAGVLDELQRTFRWKL